MIVRTAAEGATEEELTRDVERLHAQWEDIQRKAETASAPAAALRRARPGHPGRPRRLQRGLPRARRRRATTPGTTVDDYVAHVAPDLRRPAAAAATAGRATSSPSTASTSSWPRRWTARCGCPRGGSLVIDRTEAMTVVDVNTGKFTGQGGNLEETVTRNNLEAAEEIVRQLRLRDIGGIIVIDFIDMVLESNRELVLRRLTECLGRDRTKHQVAEVTSLGLVQMTRKRVGQGLLEAFCEPCERCNGRGVIVHLDPVDTGVRRGNGHSHGAGPAAGCNGGGASPADERPTTARPRGGARRPRQRRRRRRRRRRATGEAAAGRPPQPGRRNSSRRRAAPHDAASARRGGRPRTRGAGRRRPGDDGSPPRPRRPPRRPGDARRAGRRGRDGDRAGGPPVPGGVGPQRRPRRPRTVHGTPAAADGRSGLASRRSGPSTAEAVVQPPAAADRCGVGRTPAATDGPRPAGRRPASRATPSQPTGRALRRATVTASPRRLVAWTVRAPGTCVQHGPPGASRKSGERAWHTVPADRMRGHARQEREFRVYAIVRPAAGSTRWPWATS